MVAPGAAPKKKKAPKRLPPIKCVGCGRTLRRSAFNTHQHRSPKPLCKTCEKKRRQ